MTRYGSVSRSEVAREVNDALDRLAESGPSKVLFSSPHEYRRVAIQMFTCILYAEVNSVDKLLDLRVGTPGAHEMALRFSPQFRDVVIAGFLLDEAIWHNTKRSSAASHYAKRLTDTMTSALTNRIY